MLMTLLGIVTLVRYSQLTSAPLLILVTVYVCPNATNESGIEIEPVAVVGTRIKEAVPVPEVTGVYSY